MHAKVISVIDLPVICVASVVADIIAAVMQIMPADAHMRQAVTLKAIMRELALTFISRVHLRIDSAHMIRIGTRNSPRPAATCRDA